MGTVTSPLRNVASGTTKKEKEKAGPGDSRTMLFPKTFEEEEMKNHAWSREKKLRCVHVRIDDANRLFKERSMLSVDSIDANCVVILQKKSLSKDDDD